MRKRGSVLATVLIIGSVLLILGTAVSAGVINTTKLNKKYSQNIDLELAAKSGLNIVLSDFFSNATTEELINNFVVDNAQIENIYKEDTGIDVNVNFIKEGNQIIFNSIATDRENNSNVKEETKVVKLNFNNSDNDSNSDVGVLEPKKFLNITNNVYIYELNQDIASKIDFGGNIYTDRNSVPIPEGNLELSKVKFDLNTTNINKFKMEYSINDFEKKSYNINETNLVNLSQNSGNNKYIIDDNNIKINLQNESCIIAGGINAQNKEVYITLNNSTLVVNGDIFNNRKLHIIANGDSKLLIKGFVECNNGEVTINLTNSYMDVQKYIKSSGNLNITINGSYINVNDKQTDSGNSIQSTGNAVNFNIDNSSIIYSQYGIQANNNLKINSKNNSKLITKAGNLKSSYIEINLSESNLVKSDCSLIKINGDIVSGTTNRINLYNENKIHITGKLQSNGNEVFINLKNNSSCNVNEINAESLIEINLNSSNMISGNLSCEKSNVNIKSTDESKFIAGSIKSNSLSIKPVKESLLILQGGINVYSNNIEIDAENSPLFINGSIASNTFNASLKNSVLIIKGNMERIKNDGNYLVIDSVTFTNRDKSYVYIVGDIRSRALNLHSTDNINPDKSIIDLLKEFINF